MAARSGKERVVYVDGFKVRQTQDIDFGTINRHETRGFAPTWYIPEGQVWIDRRLKDETAFLVAVAAMETELDRKGIDPRRARALLAQQFCQRPRPPLDSFTRRKYRRYGFLVRELDGGTLRRTVDPLFIIGGHSKVYRYVPEGEIWLDAKMDPKELPYHLIHEAVECTLMARGIAYDVAHEYATAADKEVRRQHELTFLGDEDPRDRGTPFADFLLTKLPHQRK
jgi:hypothetical protein